MKPSPSQIAKASANHRRPPVTLGARARAAVDHVRKSSAYAAAAKIAQALQNTLRQPRNSAPLIYTALRNKKARLLGAGIEYSPVAGHSIDGRCCCGKYTA